MPLGRNYHLQLVSQFSCSSSGFWTVLRLRDVAAYTRTSSFSLPSAIALLPPQPAVLMLSR
jgi:hypothetical protein